MLKKILSFLALFIIGVIAFTSCSNARQITKNDVVTITLSGWSNLTEQQLLQQVLQNFEAKHPNIKVQYNVIADEYMDVLKTRLIGETAADVFYLDAFTAPEIMIPGVLEPLNGYISKEFNLADFNLKFLKAFQRNGKIFGLPKDFSTLALFYNKKAFKAAGLSQPPKTSLTANPKTAPASSRYAEFNFVKSRTPNEARVSAAAKKSGRPSGKQTTPAS